jgi:4-amino-4-deoxy-L-arabinose transferase-like glycosyltransferase
MPGRLPRVDRVTVALATIYLTYLISRLFLLWRLPVFWDEGFYAVEAQTAADHPAQRFQFVADGKPPLFNWVSMAVVQLGITPITAVRLVSYAAGVLTLTAVLLIARRLCGTPGALVAGTLYVVVPFVLVYNSYGLIDGLFTAGAMATLYLQIRLATKPSALTAIGTGVALGTAILTRQTGAIGVLLFPASLLLFDWSRRDRGLRLARWAGFAGLALLTSFTINLVTRLTPLHAVLSDPSQSRPPLEALKHPFAYLPGNWSGFSTAMTGYLGWPLLVVLVIAVVIAFIRRERLAVLLMLWAAAPPAAVLLLVPVGYPRYALSAVPPLLLLAAYGLVALAGAIRERLVGVRATGALLLGAAVLLAVPVILDVRVLANPSTANYPAEDRYQYVSGWPAGTRLDQIKAALDREAPAGRTFVAAVGYTPWNLAALYDHPDRIPIGANPPLDAVLVRASGGRSIEFATVTPANVAHAQFILQHGIFAIPPWMSLRGFHLIAAFTRPAGSESQVTTVQLFERNQ